MTLDEQRAEIDWALKYAYNLLIGICMEAESGGETTYQQVCLSIQGGLADIIEAMERVGWDVPRLELEGERLHLEFPEVP